ncbi:hypothetical protein BJ170DRAFT_682124 [Xylariales sp. AK1849]|nr:hypothetical protein BJ170DRAFT_682124 [Xylariales sp. AK1849]
MANLDDRTSDKDARTNRHIACNKCRLRKVRCDGRKPFCKRCASGRSAWEYKTLNGLASLTCPPGLLSPVGGTGCESPPGEPGALDLVPPFDLALYDIDPPNAIFDEVLQYGHGLDDVFSSVYHSLSASTCSSSSSSSSRSPSTSDDVAVELTEDDETPPVMFPPEAMQFKSFQTAMHDGGVEAQLHHLPPEILDLLLSAYFNSCQSTIRLFDDQDSLSCLMQQSTYDGLALKHVICAHAVQSCPQFSVWAVANMEGVAPGCDYQHLFYQLAREALDKCDLEKKFSEPSLQSLQAAILIGLYELEHAEFARAWLTASRASWLTQTMQLQALDPDQVPYVSNERLEEARKALWAANSLSWFLMRGDRLVDFVNIEEITTLLPQSNTPDSWAIPGIRIGDVFRNAASRPLLVDEALLAARMLGPRILMHVKTIEQTTSSQDQQPYNFWTNQYRLEETLRYVLNFTITDPNPKDNIKAVLDLQVKALGIVLHGAMLKKMRSASHQNQKSSEQLQINEYALLQRTLELVEAVQTSILFTDAATSLTRSWAAYVALQSLLRHQRRSSAEQLDRMTTAWSCPTAGADGGTGTYHMGSGGYIEPANPVGLTSALVLDAFDALHSTLIEWADKSPIAAFFLEQVKLECVSGDDAVDKRIVGLVDFTARSHL